MELPLHLHTIYLDLRRKIAKMQAVIIKGADIVFPQHLIDIGLDRKLGKSAKDVCAIK